MCFFAINKLFSKNVVLSRLGQKKKRKNFHILEFEKKICNLTKSKYALAVSSGTAALKIALKSFGVKPGDEVITQAFNFVATVEAIVDIGAKPVIVGIDDSLNINIHDLKRKITKKTKVIIPVHMLRRVWYEKCNIIKKHKIKILKKLRTFGAKYNKNYLGIRRSNNLTLVKCSTGEGGIIHKFKLWVIKRIWHGHKNIKGTRSDKSNFEV